MKKSFNIIVFCRLFYKRKTKIYSLHLSLFVGAKLPLKTTGVLVEYRFISVHFQTV